MKNIFHLSHRTSLMKISVQGISVDLPEQSKSNSDQLLQIVLKGNDSFLRKKAWEILLLTNHTVCTYMDIIEYAPDEFIRTDAWKILRSCHLEYAQLYHLIKWAPNEIIRIEAWEKLSATNISITYLINITRNSVDVVIRNAAGKKLLSLLKYNVNKDQHELMKRIAGRMFHSDHVPGRSKWHVNSKIIDWAFYLDKDVKKIGKRSNPKVAAYALLPAYAPLFFLPVEEIKTALKELIL